MTEYYSQLYDWQGKHAKEEARLLAAERSRRQRMRRIAGGVWLTAITLTTAALTIILFALLPQNGPSDGHTRCGVCRYILKGLLEPRCPECGRRI